MGINNVNVQGMEKFAEEVGADPTLAKKHKRVEGSWDLGEGHPQFVATLSYATGARTVEADLAPFMGGEGLAPDPIQYCLYGVAACYAGTFASLAAAEGVELRGLNVVAENLVDLSQSMGLSDSPVVEQVSLTLQVDADADDATLAELERLAKERCPGVYCLTNPIPLDAKLERMS